MPAYQNYGGNSSVRSWSVGQDLDGEPFLLVTFKPSKSGGPRNYVYTPSSVGSPNLLYAMIRLANAGVGLGSFIYRRARFSYSRKF